MHGLGESTTLWKNQINGVDIVRKIIDKHHGRITVQSEVDIGT